MAHRKSKTSTCLHCEDVAIASGLCRPCYQWERYHRLQGHGTQYFQKYVARNERLIRRAQAMTKLRIVARGGAR